MDLIKNYSDKFKVNAFSFNAPPIYRKQLENITKQTTGKVYDITKTNLEYYMLEVLKENK